MTVKDRLKEFLKYENIGQAAFEKKVGLSNGYVNNIRKSIQPDKVQSISLIYPRLNTGWLLTGEGEMLKANDPPVPYGQKNVNGDNIAGSNVTVNKSQADKFIDLLAKKDEQIDRLISVIERMTNK